MSRLIINNFNEFAQHIGQELGVSDYLTITQEQIDLFADATLDPVDSRGHGARPDGKPL